MPMTNQFEDNYTDVISAEALQALMDAQATGDLGAVDVDTVCRLARDASVDPAGAFKLFDKSFGKARPDPSEVYSHIVGAAFDARHDLAMDEAIERSGAEMRARTDARLEALASASRLPPDAFQGVVSSFEAGDPSPMRQMAERMYYS